MRHRCRIPQLGLPADQRKALLRSLATSVLRYGQVTTTKARAKAVQAEVDKIITLAKEGSLAARRQAMGYIYDKQVVHALFAEAPKRYAERKGGYTRVVRTMPRRGDNSAMAIVQLM